MASIVTWLIGLLFLFIGAWILLLRFEGLVDLFQPHTISIGQMTVDGTESRGHAELLRARFGHHFRRPLAIPKETGFLEVVSLDLPELFRERGQESTLEKVTVDVSGVDVARMVQFVNQLAKPDQWVVEGDFQTQPDRALLALRLRRGERLIRTWYLERLQAGSTAKSVMLEQLIDDAIFQLVYDLGNGAEQDRDLQRWRRMITPPTAFPSRTSVAAYYEARGALSRYYTHGTWQDLDLAIDRLRTLRAQMPEYADGLQLLAMALAEKRNESEAVHVYEQLRSVLLSREEDRDALDSPARRRLLKIDLLKATATAKQSTWQTAHEAVRQLTQLSQQIPRDAALPAAQSPEEKAAYKELEAHTAVQLAHTYANYLWFIQHYAIADMFGDSEAPAALRVTDPHELDVLRNGPARESRAIVRRVMKAVANEHDTWIEAARASSRQLEPIWEVLREDASRRRAELASRLNLAIGYAKYRMAELERHDAAAEDTVFGVPFSLRLQEASAALRSADAAHPNHYLVLQLLGQVYSEPRRNGEDVTVAEQYFDRATQANPSDSFGHELAAGVQLRRLAHIGVDLQSRETIEKGLAEARRAVAAREMSGTAHLLRAQFQELLLEIETDPVRRRELRAELDQYIQQADRFLPRVFNRPDVALSWVRVVNAAHQLAEPPAVGQTTASAAQRESGRASFGEARTKIVDAAKELIADCARLEERWVAQQRVYEVRRLGQRARRLVEALEAATAETWRDVRIPVL